MANGIYANFMRLLLTNGNSGTAPSGGYSSMDLTAASKLKFAFVDTGVYSVSLTTDNMMSDVTGGALATGEFLSGVSVATSGVIDASDMTPGFSAPTNGTNATAMVLYYDGGGGAADQTLIAYYDTFSGGSSLNLPLGGTNVNITIDATNGLFKWTT